MDTNSTTSREETPQSDQATPQMFHEPVDELFRAAAQSAFLKSPELRTVCTIYDWHGGLNDAEGISKGVWLGEQGGPNKPIDSVVGTAKAMLTAFAHVVTEMMEQVGAMENHAVSLSEEILKLESRLAELKKVASDEPKSKES